MRKFRYGKKRGCEASFFAASRRNCPYDKDFRAKGSFSWAYGRRGLAYGRGFLWDFRILWNSGRRPQYYFVLIVEHPDGLVSLFRRVLNTSHKARVGDCFSRVRVYINMRKGGLVEF